MSTLSDPRAGLMPDLYGYALMHDAILRDFRRLGPAIEAVRTRDDASALSAWFERFDMVIVHHHEREDDVLFPLFERRVAGFDARDLVADHLELDRLLDELRPALGALGSSATSSTGPLPDAVAHAARVAHELDRLMVDHIAVEEEIVFPLVTDRLSPDDWALAEREVQKGISVRVMTFTLPWVLDGADAAMREHVVSEVPFVFRAFDSLLWERSYRRLAAPLRRAES